MLLFYKHRRPSNRTIPDNSFRLPQVLAQLAILFEVNSMIMSREYHGPPTIRGVGIILSRSWFKLQFLSNILPCRAMRSPRFF